MPMRANQSSWTGSVNRYVATYPKSGENPSTAPNTTKLTTEAMKLGRSAAGSKSSR